MEANPETGATELSVDDAANALLSKWESQDSTEETEVEVQADTEMTDEVETEEVSMSDVQEPESAEEALDFESIQDLAEALDMPPEKFLEKIKGKVKVDGEESEISLQEALNGYQRQADYQRKTAEIAEQRRQFEQIRAQQQNELAQRNHIAQASLQAAENVLMQEFAGINWQHLEATDPGTAALYRQKFADRQNEIRTYQNQLLQQQEYERQVREAEQQQFIQRYVEEQKSQLRAVSPDWTPETNKALASYLVDSGFSPEEVGSMVDHRHALIARKAMLYDQQQKSVDVAKAKVKPLPKMLKPNSKTRNGKMTSEKMNQLKQRLKQSGTVQDAAALILERMN